MKIALCTLCLNEMEWLPRLYEQHKDWLDLVSWVFVESADRVYAETSPERVTDRGLSVDGTTDYLASLAHSDKRVTHIPYGFCGGYNRRQGKCDARTQYLRVLDVYEPNIFVVLDADEFYTRQDQLNINTVCSAANHFSAYLFPQRHIWYPPSRVGSDIPLMSDEVVGGYWGVPHYRVWRWTKGLHYSRNHNWPETSNDVFLNRRSLRYDRSTRLYHSLNLSVPTCVHMGFASSLVSRKAKHEYYKARGEGMGDSRGMYVECRSAYESWVEGEQLPHGAKVVPYTGPILEVFRSTSSEHTRRPDSSNKLLPPAEHATSNPGVAGTDGPLPYRRR